LFVLVASGETLNGIARTVLLNKCPGVVRAKRYSMLTAWALCLLTCYCYVPAIGIRTDRRLLYLGISLAVFMLGFYLALGRLELKASWAAILDDFNLCKGNLLAAGMVAMVFCPLLSAKNPRLF